MTEPTFDYTTEKLYYSLPDVFRTEDEEQSYTLKKWLSGIAGVQQGVRTLIERFSYVPPEDGDGYRTSDLVDPETADPAWLSWLAQLVGVQLSTTLSVPDQRTQIEESVLGIKAGTKDAIAAAARTVLVGEKSVKVFDHSDNISIGTASQWSICLLTKDSETLKNAVPVDQSTFSSTNGWNSNSWFVNRVGNATWTTTGMTASTGTTNPLLASYDTFSGSGNTYVSATATPGVSYEGSVMLRCSDGLATTATLDLVFLNGTTQVGISTAPVSGLNTNWKQFRVSGVAPASTTAVRLRLTRAATGVLEVSNKSIAPGTNTVYFDSTFAGTSVEDSSGSTLPIVNYWRNASFDVAGGYNVANGTLTVTGDRFRYGTSAGLFTITATSPTLSPNQAMPVFEGETAYASVRMMAGQSSGQVRMELRFTLANGTTSSVFGSWTNTSDSDFVLYSVTGTAPANAKSVSVYVAWDNIVGNAYYVDGGYFVRTINNVGYFDGNMTTATWSDANHANAIAYLNSALPANIVKETFVPDSNALRIPAYATGMVLRSTMNLSRAGMTVSASDPWTFMLSAYALQAGSYTLVFTAVHYNSSGTETGRNSVAYMLTSAMSPVNMSMTVTTPASTTQTRLRLYVYGAQMGDTFGVARAGGRLGQVTDWVAVTADPVAAVIKAGAKPAGVILYTQQFSASWSAIEAALPTWADWEGKTWGQIEEIGLP